MKSEFEFIENLRQKYSLNKIGDDCAVLPEDSKTDLVVTTDLLIEDIDFRLKWTKPEFLGHKSLAVSLSDIAAMGAKPVWAMISIGIPETIWKTDFVDRFYEGWFGLANRFGVELVGGDISKTDDKIVIDSIATGETKKGKAILRSTATVGDLIFVTGKLGGAAIGLQLLEAGEKYEKSVQKNLLLRQLAPNPQTEIGQIIGAKNLATAMIDLSDGLSSDLAHLCQASKVGAKIFADKIPTDNFLQSHKIAKPELQIPDFKFQIEDKLTCALNGGEDFELLFTVNPKKKIQVANWLKNHQVSAIGEITSNVEIIKLITDEKSEVLRPQGFRHF